MSAHFLTIAGGDGHLDLEPGKVYSLGKDPQADLVLADHMLTGRRHAEVEVIRSQVVLRPLAASGTYVNGSRITTGVKLQKGDRIGIGKQTVVVSDVAVGASPEGGDDASEGGDDGTPGADDSSAFDVLETLGDEPSPEAEKPEAAPKRAALGPGAGGKPPPQGERRSLLGARPSAPQGPGGKAPTAGKGGATAGSKSGGSGRGFPTLANYDLLTEIADVKGGRAFHAKSKTDGRDVIVKVLEKDAAKDEALVERFTREALALRRLAHPNIVQIRAAGRDAGMLYYATEFVAATTLADLLRNGPIDVKTALSIGIQIGNALVLAHGAQVIHRDVSPAAIVVTDQGIAKLFNFAFVKNLADERARSVTAMTDVVGDISYCSPEQATDPRSVGGASDLYSLGATVFRAIAGRPPFSGRNQLEQFRLLVTQDPPALVELLPTIPLKVSDVIAKFVARDPAKRWQTAEEAVEALHTALAFAAEAAHAEEKRIAGTPTAFDGLTTSKIAAGLGGEFKNLELVEILQFLEFTKKSGALAIEGVSCQGEIYLRDGLLVGAHVGAETGAEAATALLLNRSGNFLFRPALAKDKLPMETLKLKPSAIAVDVMRKLDEINGVTPEPT